MDNLIYILFVSVFVPILLMACLVEKKARQPIVFVLIGIFVSVFASEVNGLMVALLPLSTFEITIIVTPITEEILKAFPILLFAVVLSAKKEALFALRRTVLHPVTLAAVLGLFFFFLPIEDKIPKLLTESLGMLSDTVAPLSMVVIGLRLADTRFGRILCERQTYLFLALRHLVLPLAVLLLLKGGALIFPSIDTTVTSIILILAACPAASSATMFAERYGCDAAYAGKLVTISTAISILTMPLLLLLV